ncbi:MAG: hypothetical protein IT373_07290 [Polyangiaceae bacterium]|nr:hypothetical protein [Polyangiaceae bacterium]
MARTLVLGDLHLTRTSPAALADDLGRLCAGHPGARLVLTGDVFDFAADAPHAPRERCLEALLLAQPTVRRALGEHVSRGGSVTFVGGNHDAALATEPLRHALAVALRLDATAAARLRTSPWFWREGGLHVEHGHMYDPDNALPHPLAEGAPSLGLHFSTEFLHPTGAYAYLAATDGTPLAMLRSAFRWYGRRGPYVVYRYFYAALGALGRSGPFFAEPARAARSRGAAELARFAAGAGAPAAELERLVGLGARPRLESLADTFARLYLDRVAALLALAAGAGLAAGARPRAAGLAAGLGLGALLVSFAAGHDRYGGSVADRLERAAGQVAELTGAHLVVFGHSHVASVAARYANPGSFAFPRGAPGRPYLELEGPPEAPHAVLRHVGG